MNNDLSIEICNKLHSLLVTPLGSELKQQTDYTGYNEHTKKFLLNVLWRQLESHLELAIK